MERKDLTKLLKSPDSLEDDIYFSSSDHVELLKKFLIPKAKVVWSKEEGSYNGEIVALLYWNGLWILWRDSFGSCSYCDGIEACNSNSDVYEYFLDTMQEGNTKQFTNIEELFYYICDLDIAEQYFWSVALDQEDIKEIVNAAKENDIIESRW